MGFFKQVVTAFRPSSIARGLDAARHPPDQAAIAASLAGLTPEQRAAYDRNMAAVERGRTQGEAAWREAKATADRHRVLEGPAGRYVYGAGPGDVASPAEIEAGIAERGMLGTVAALRRERKGELMQGVRQSLGMSEVKEIADAGERAAAAAAERAARDAARAGYRAPDAVPATISRLATRGQTQLAELVAFLQESGLAARPEAVFGVYRVPDRISSPLTPHSERGRVVEWDVVHAAGPLGPPAPVPLVATSFLAAEHWVARRIGEPSVLDEDLALAHCLEAGIGPERCVGVARVSELRTLRGDGDADGAGDLRALVKGVVALHPEESSGAFGRLRAAAPIALPDGQRAAAGVHVELINWEAIGRAVHPRLHHPPPVPSPFPYLPSTPQELLLAHLEIVGLRPSDCYSAQATVDRPRALVAGGLLTTNLGPRQPCADGEPRMRTRACELLVVAYRDRPEYAEGRARWAAYEAEVLQARLGNGLAAGRPVQDADDLADIPTRALRAAVRVIETVDRWDEWGTEKVPPHRYCWPPVG